MEQFLKAAEDALRATRDEELEVFGGEETETLNVLEDFKVARGEDAGQLVFGAGVAREALRLCCGDGTRRVSHGSHRPRFAGAGWRPRLGRLILPAFSILFYLPLGCAGDAG